MIKNIVFDLGRVLVEFNPEKYLNNNYDKEKSKELLDIIFKSDTWLELDRGVITNDKAIEIISNKYPNYTSDINYILKNWYKILTPMEETCEILKELSSKEYNLYLLSNFHKEAFLKISKMYSFFDYFDGSLISYQVKSIKPERKIYDKLCSKFEISVSESIFIDDMYDNIDAARRLGFKVIKFKSAILLRDRLKDLNI